MNDEVQIEMEAENEDRKETPADNEMKLLTRGKEKVKWKRKRYLLI